MSYESGHYYTQDGKPAHFVPRADGKGQRPTTIRDAKANNLLPSVTTILKVLHKQGLVNWLIMQNVMAALTTPRKQGESLDDFASRVMSQDAEQEAQKARDLGTEIHAGLESMLSGGTVAGDLLPWIEPAYNAVRELCPTTIATEIVLVGNGYAGKADFIGTANGISELIIDFKSAKKLPDKSWPEAKLQLSAYAEARASKEPWLIQTANCYISTTEKGAFALHMNPAWEDDFEHGFRPLVQYWQWSTGYTPKGVRLGKEPSPIEIVSGRTGALFKRQRHVALWPESSTQINQNITRIDLIIFEQGQGVEKLNHDVKIDHCLTRYGTKRS